MSNPLSPNRRQFLGKVGAATAATVAVGLEPLIVRKNSNARAAAVGQTWNKRAVQCEKVRKDAALANRLAVPPNLKHPTNVDDELYADKAGSYSKGLPHNPDGTVVVGAYSALVQALSSSSEADFDAIPLGGDRKLTNPQSGLAFDSEGPDSHALVQPPAPAFSSRQQAAEIVENYWMALLRDIPFADYAAHPLASQAAADLSSFGADFKGLKDGGVVTPATLFRGLTPGDRVGPYLSQFFYQPCYFGANEIEQKITTVRSISDGGTDYLTDYASWLSAQKGVSPAVADNLDPVRRYMRNGRDIGQWVHIDVLFQAYFHAFLVIAGWNAPVDDGNPYKNNPTQAGFGTFGGPHIATLLCEVATRALKAVWYQKWLVHRRLRPEAFAGRIEYNRTHPGRFDVHPSVNGSAVLPLISAHNQARNLAAGNGGGATYLLPVAFPEGSPTHPAYGAGHATVAGACVTILKAWFEESTRLVDLGVSIVEPTADGSALVPYTGADAANLTVGGELNKVAANVALGRDIAGVHWRSDATESLLLGEQVAIGILKDQRGCYNETFNGFSLTRFDGTTITV